MPETILVTPRSLTGADHPELDRLRRRGFALRFAPPGRLPDEGELLRLVPGCVGWLAGIEPVSARVIDRARDLRIIARNGTGTDSLPLELLRSRGVAVALARGANAVGVGELALGLMFAAARAIPQCDAGIKAGQWPRPMGFELRGSTIGLVGCGMIGREVARLGIAIGAKVVAFDPAAPAHGFAAASFRYAPLPEVLAAAEVLSLHLPLAPGAGPLLDAAALAMLPPGAVVVNTARAGLVDAPAMLAALDAHRIAAYCTDVFDHEPPLDCTLARHPRVIATTHVGGLTRESVDRATRAAVDALLAALR